jgi:DNA-binding NarL/FixJ family response regulator/class 3 adenylate cyclase
VAGTTTIMFTDLVMSSEILADLGGDGYAELFRAHVTVLRRPIEARGGRITKLLGDGVLATFESSYDGVLAAIAVQQEVDLSIRRGGLPIGVRIGLSVGEVVSAADDLFGSALVAARRLCDVADPGQILVSELILGLIGSRSDVRIEPAGHRDLKGVGVQVAVAEVRWTPLPDEVPLRVTVADDAPLIRSGIVRLLNDAGFTVVAAVGDAEALVRVVDADPPDLVITDIRMPPTNTNEGLLAAATIRYRHPEVAVLVLSQYVETHSAAALLDGRQAGVGYLLKERVGDLDEFVDACRSIASGGSIIDPSVSSVLVRSRARDAKMERLTDREREVLELMAQGRSNQAISEELTLGIKTVESHVRQMFQKLELEERPDGNRRVQAVLHWLQQANT